MSENDHDKSVLRCVCGRTGEIRSHESDKGWGSLNTDYYIDGFGKTLSTNIEFRSSFHDAIATIKPKCPDCDRTLTSEDIDRPPRRRRSRG